VCVRECVHVRKWGGEERMEETYPCVKKAEENVIELSTKITVCKETSRFF
jgi:hypothetical protein